MKTNARHPQRLLAAMISNFGGRSIGRWREAGITRWILSLIITVTVVGVVVIGVVVLALAPAPTTTTTTPTTTATTSFSAVDSFWIKIGTHVTSANLMGASATSDVQTSCLAQGSVSLDCRQ